MNRAFDDGRKQQNGEQNVKDQFFNRCPDAAVYRGESAKQVAEQNQSKIGNEELGVVQRAALK